MFFFFFSSRRRHTRWNCDWSSDVCSSDLEAPAQDMMARLFKEDGLGVDRWQIHIDDLKHLPGYSPHAQDYDDAWNVVGAWRPSSPNGRSLILNGHIDVVPEGPHEMWARNPFEP